MWCTEPPPSICPLPTPKPPPEPLNNHPPPQPPIPLLFLFFPTAKAVRRIATLEPCRRSSGRPCYTRTVSVALPNPVCPIDIAAPLTLSPFLSSYISLPPTPFTCTPVAYLLVLPVNVMFSTETMVLPLWFNHYFPFQLILAPCCFLNSISNSPHSCLHLP